MGSRAAATGAMATVGPNAVLELPAGGVLVGEHFGESEEADAVAMAATGRLIWHDETSLIDR